MKSIYSTFTGLFKDGKPIDFLATWKKTLDKASEREVALFQKTYSDEWFDWEAPQLSLRAEGIMGKYHLRVMATLIGDESPTPLRRSDGFDIWNEEIPRSDKRSGDRTGYHLLLGSPYDYGRLRI